jgi:branched-chain amino acid transport system substrate-binding protein
VTLSARLAAVVVSAAVLLAACSGSDEATPTTSLPATTTTAPVPTQTDGRLKIGILLPTSDTVIGDPMVAGIEEAIERINASGGVLGAPISTVIADEGSTTASASSSIQTLLAGDVDAIVGPGSSLLALGTLDEIVSSGTLACSPTASALALDDFPDGGLFFRTIPSDSLQAQAIAQAADQTGALTATIVHVDDAYGRGLADAVETSMAAGVISVASTITFSGRDDDLADEARQLVDSGSPVAIILANGDDATRFIETLDDLDTTGITTIVVNDAVRNTSSPQLIAGIDAELRDKVVGLAPQAESHDPDAPFDPPGLFATNAYDCVNLIALAAVRAESDAPRDIAAQMASVSASGQVCGGFADCVAAIDSGRQVDYDGPSGLTQLEVSSGDPERAIFDRFVFGPDGEDVFERNEFVGG